MKESSRYNEFLSFLFCAFLFSYMLMGCAQQTGNSSKTSSSQYDITVKDDSLFISTSKKGTQRLLYSIMGKASKSKSFSGKIAIDMKRLACEDGHLLMEYSYNIAKTGVLPMRFTIGKKLDTTVMVKYNRDVFAKGSSSRIVSGPCLKLVPKSVTESQEKEIKKWLYNRGTYAEDDFIHIMAIISNWLSESSFNDFMPEDGKTIPVLSSLDDVHYRIHTDIKADYYSLFATADYSRIKQFISENISNNFAYSEKNPNSAFHCWSISRNNGVMVIFLIATNKDWTTKIIPVGLVGVDDIAPDISTSDGVISKGTPHYTLIMPGHKDLVLREIDTRITLPPDIPDLSGWVNVSTGQFQGNNAQFTISFGGDVKAMIIKREIHSSHSWMEPDHKIISFIDQRSPIHFTYELDLNIGDNYIPITVVDERGNSSDISYHIKMVRIKDND